MAFTVVSVLVGADPPGLHEYVTLGVVDTPVSVALGLAQVTVCELLTVRVGTVVCDNTDSVKLLVQPVAGSVTVRV